MALRVTQPLSGVHRFESVYTNSYLLEEGGRLTLVDGGLLGDWGSFVSHVTRLGYRIEDIDAVLVTHHHLDHVGNAERLRSMGSRVFTHPEDAPNIREEIHVPIAARARYLLRPWYAAYMLRLLSKGITRVPSVAEVHLMSDGEVVDVPRSPRVVHVPGHTAGSCALLIEQESVLFTGDALVTTDVTRGRRRGPQIIRGPDTEDASLALESLAILAETGATTLLPGHGDPWNEGVARAVELALET